MANEASPSDRKQRGFSLVELLVVAAVIALVAAFAVPRIAEYMHNYRIRSAVRSVVGDLQAARSRAIMTNTNWGVSFVIVDADSYRFVLEDQTRDPATVVGDTQRYLSPLRDLPSGVRFVQRGLASSIRFRKLGDFCYPAPAPDGNCTSVAAGTGPSWPTAYATCVSSDGAHRCAMGVNGQGSNYFDVPGAKDLGVAGGLVVEVIDVQANLIGRVQLAPGGKVSADYRQAR